MTTILPEYSRPPVAETALVVRFEPSIDPARIGALWPHFWNEFPKTSTAPPAAVPVEQFGHAQDAGFAMQFQLMAPPMRLYFISQDDAQLVQIQPDLFGRNWRRQSDDDTYPRYQGSQRERFLRDYQTFLSALRDEHFAVGSTRAVQCEVVYINHIVAGQTWKTHTDFAKVFCGGAIPTRPYEGAVLEDLAANARYQILDSKQKPIGRLHVSIQPGIRNSDRRPVFSMNLTARGAPADQTLEGIMKFFDRGREAIVQSFTALTTPEMHVEWGRTR